MSKPQMNYKIRDNNGQISAGLGWLFTLLWLHTDNLLRCFPSHDLLKKEAGITNATLTKYRDQLIQMKAIIIIPHDKRLTELEKKLHQRKHVYQITGMIELADGKVLPTMNFSSPESIASHLSILSSLAFDVSPLIELHKSKFQNLILSDFSIISSTSLESLSSTNSFAEKSAKDVSTDNPDLPTMKKEDATIADLKVVIDHMHIADWKTKILTLLTDGWLSAMYLEQKLDLPDMHLSPLSFSDGYAYKALHDLEHDRQIEFMAIEGEKYRLWRLHSDYGQPAPKSDFDLLKSAIERRLDISNGALLNVTHMLMGTSAKKDSAYYKEAEFFQDENQCTPDDIDAMADLFEKTHPDGSLPARPEVISNWIAKARKAKENAQEPDHMSWTSEPEPEDTIFRIPAQEDES